MYKINDDYIIGDDRCIYRLPYNAKSKSYSLRKIKKHRGGYFINGIFIEKSLIKYHPIEPYEIINDEIIPF